MNLGPIFPESNQVFPLMNRPESVLGFLLGLADIDRAMYIVGEPPLVLLPMAMTASGRQVELASLLQMIHSFPVELGQSIPEGEEARAGKGLVLATGTPGSASRDLGCRADFVS